MEKKRIFLSYRRDDSGDITGRIHEHLSKIFGEEAIFFDVIKSIPLGREFGEYITEAVSEVSVMLVIIGKQWADIKDANGIIRLFKSDDWVRLEVEAGLARGSKFPTIPIFVQGSSLNENQLPAPLKPLSRRNGLQIRREPDFKHDIESLIEGITALGVSRLPESDDSGREKRTVKADHGSIAIGGNANGSTFHLGLPTDKD
jgi:hypothetical protein